MRHDNIDAQYGSLTGPQDKQSQTSLRDAIWTVGQMVLLIAIPSAIFAGLSWSLISLPLYLHPSFRTIIVVATATAVLLMILAALLSRGNWLRKGGRLGNAEPRYLHNFAWWGTLAALSTVAFVAGLSVGDTLEKNMSAYYDINTLNKYDNLDPARTLGRQRLDAGRVIFTQGSRLSLNQSMRYQKNGGASYCVVPIVAAVSEPLPATFDFWAIGKDCCSEDGKDFHCGAATDHSARGGIRVVDEGDVEKYREAVQLAEEAHRIQSVHPLFFEWVANPIGELVSTKEQVFQQYCTDILVFSAVMAALVCVGFLYLYCRQKRR